MDPATQLAGVVAGAGAAYLAAGLLLDGVRWLTKAPLPGLPSLRPLLAAVTMLVVLGRVAPAAATTPPPAQRLTGGGGGMPAVEAEPPPPIAAAVTAPSATYRVALGDSLWSIARQRLATDASVADVAAYWPVIYEANAALIGPDPDLIHPGQVLELPEAP